MPPEIFDDAIEPELVLELKDAILDRAKPGVPYPGGANRGGWKSSVDLFDWPERGFQRLRGKLAAVLDAAGGFALGNAWAIVNKAGSYHGRHRHGVPLMGILFVAPGDPAVPTIYEHGAQIIEVAPAAGRLVLAGDLMHSVPPYYGKSPRIVIAFDSKLA
jgi:hypothetical protein